MITSSSDSSNRNSKSFPNCCLKKNVSFSQKVPNAFWVECMTTSIKNQKVNKTIIVLKKLNINLFR